MNGSSFMGNIRAIGWGVVGMPFKDPFILWPFAVDAEGRLSPAHRGISPGFSVQWRGRVVHARLGQSNGHDGHLHMEASLGRMPSSASDPVTRAACFTMLRGLLSALPHDWAARLLPDHQPRLEVEATVTLPITVRNLVAELTVFLLTLSPYMDLMDRAGVGLVPALARHQ